MSEQIETLEALDALPVGSVVRVLAAYGVGVWVKAPEYGGRWLGIEADDEDAQVEAKSRYLREALPATVLFRPDAPTPTPAGEGHHHDIEKHAEHFNEGYDEAQRQSIGGPEAREWFVGKVVPILRSYGVEEHDGADDIAGDIADAVLTEAPLTDDTPTPAGDDQREALARVREVLDGAALQHMQDGGNAQDATLTVGEIERAMDVTR